MRKAVALLALVLAACSPGETVKEGLTTTLEGSPATLEEIAKGRPAIVNFWASWCSFCEEEMPLLNSLQAQFPQIAVVGVNLQEEQAVARAYVEAGAYTFSILLDPGAELKSRFGVFTQPTTVILDSAGKEIARKDGPFTPEELMQWSQLLLGGEEPGAGAMEEPAAVDVETSLPTFLLSSWYGGEVRHTIPLEDILSGGPARDGIPAVDSPQFVEASLATEDLNSLRGVLVVVGEEAHFYPFAILNWHEVVNDTVGGSAVTVSYCPLCASAVVYERTTSRGEDTFGVSGLLYESNLLLYDRNTLSLWDQIRGEAVVGPLAGERLKRVKSDIVALSTVKEFWPEAKVLSTETGYVRQYELDPYEGYDAVETTYFPVGTVDDRISGKERVYGIVVDGMAKAYTVDAIREEKRIQEVIGGVPVLVQYDEKTDRVRFTRFFPDDAEKKEEVLPVHAFWFAWVAQYPETDLYE